jgi:L-fuconolactonase
MTTAEGSPRSWYAAADGDWLPAAPWPRADAHIHLVRREHRAWAAAREDVDATLIDEPRAYDAHARTHGIASTLVVATGEDNNPYVRAAAEQFRWVRPLVAFGPAQLSVDALEEALATTRRVAGVSLQGGDAEELAAVDPAVWRWLDERSWLISQNNSGEGWLSWRPILQQTPTLRLLIAHCGLPLQAPPSERERPAPPDVLRERLATVLALAEFAGPRVKLSGFYALGAPSHDFPHRQAWGYVETLLEAFGVERLLWGSDFSPALSHLSFPQTIDLFDRMPFVSEEDRRKIEGANLLALLDDLDSRGKDGNAQAAEPRL